MDKTIGEQAWFELQNNRRTNCIRHAETKIQDIDEILHSFIKEELDDESSLIAKTKLLEASLSLGEYVKRLKEATTL